MTTAQRKRLQVYLWLPTLVGGVGDPTPVVREAAFAFVESSLNERLQRTTTQRRKPNIGARLRVNVSTTR